MDTQRNQSTVSPAKSAAWLTTFARIECMNAIYTLENLFAEQSVLFRVYQVEILSRRS